MTIDEEIHFYKFRIAEKQKEIKWMQKKLEKLQYKQLWQKETKGHTKKPNA